MTTPMKQQKHMKNMALRWLNLSMIGPADEVPMTDGELVTLADGGPASVAGLGLTLAGERNALHEAYSRSRQGTDSFGVALAKAIDEAWDGLHTAKHSRV